jgi:mannosidase alpha-like ER degradation enhancer 2
MRAHALVALLIALRGLAMPLEERRELREEARRLFSFAWDNYNEHAFPADVLQPISCKGKEEWGGIALTLVDTLDTLALMGNASEFERGVRYCVEQLSFDVDSTVSLFETNIRALGGLLAAHAFASDGSLGLLSGRYPDDYRGKHGAGLLPLALDLGRRLLPALDTPSGIPYGSINLRRGVDRAETPVVCAAAVGTLVMEFGALSRWSGEARFEAAAKRAAVALWKLRSEHDLVGEHVNLRTGVWTQADAGVGRGIDSFYEYMLKGHMLLGDIEYLAIFHDAYHAALRHLKQGPWYVDVHLATAQMTWPLYNSLQSFWPGLQMLLGELELGVETLRAFHTLWRELGFHPEGFNLAAMQVQPGQTGYAARSHFTYDLGEFYLGLRALSHRYPLRPEHVESLFWAHRTTHADEWLHAGRDVLRSLERLKLPCGLASVADVSSGTLEDKMESFFLSETAKHAEIRSPR